MKLISKYQNPAGPLKYANFFFTNFKDPISIQKENQRKEDENFYELILDNALSFVEKRLRNNESYTIPFIPNKKITLSNAGKDTGVSFSTNLLDSIAKYSKLANIPLQDALGLVGQESTFGKGRGQEGYDIDPINLVSDWDYIGNNPYLELITSSLEKVNNRTVDYDDNKIVYNKDYIKSLKEGFPYAEKLYNQIDVNEPVLKHAFKKFKSGKYNLGDPRHTSMVKLRGKDLMKSPEILLWLKSK